MARAIDTLLMHWLSRAFYCPRGQHRDRVVCVGGALAYDCVDCRRSESLGPVYRHGTNRKTGWRA